MSAFLQDFARRFADLDADTLDRLPTLYTDDVRFRDPLHEIQGIQALHAYFEKLYANVESLRFDFQGMDEVRAGEGYLRWVMTYRHPRIARGEPVQVEGCSHLLWRDKVHAHRDYFDAGALLYEHLPLLGGAISLLKGRLA
ncbi:FIG002994: Putative transcriptional regulator [plant metagenome]|uniref:FIG002994: Putative transcriptional regulator n=2 Tax=root TaxID=1 RepID=A0A1C3K341_9BURK|nr:nuclear transport factor 2 family protein [Orrella dioscoreae]SBT25916.1 FIG002994: Putative transcriptional regulator [Orrella dioscoreae]SOE51833.1 FIG002994: Putative transcriptional regulator [Orrella dioscoreae]